MGAKPPETMGPRVFSGPAGGQDLARIMAPQSDFTYCTFLDLELSGVAGKQCAFDGALFRGCTFRNCNFERSEFDGATFEGCHFLDCDLSVADLRSTRMVNSTFKKTIIDHCEFRLSQVTNCSFTDCSMVHQTFSENQIFKSSFINCLFARGSAHHIIFSETSFERTDFADCTALYLLFDRCAFNKIKFNVQTMGTSLGLSSSDLSQVVLVWQGTVVRPPDDGNLIDDLLTTFKARSWALGVAVLDLNFERTTRLSALAAVLNAILAPSDSHRPIKRDEIIFFQDVIKFYASVPALPFLFLTEALEVISRREARAENSERAVLRQLYYGIHVVRNELLTQLDSHIMPLLAPGTARVGTAILHFSWHPTVDLACWFATITEATGLKSDEIQILSERSGSWLVEMRIAAQTLALFIIIMFLVEGVIHRLTLIRARLTVLVRPTLPEKFHLQALDAPQISSKELLKLLQPAIAFASSWQGSDAVQASHKLTKSLEGMDFIDGS